MTPLEEAISLYGELRNTSYPNSTTHYWTAAQYERFCILVADGLNAKLNGVERRRSIPEVVRVVRGLFTRNPVNGNYEIRRFQVPVIKIIGAGINAL